MTEGQQPGDIWVGVLTVSDRVAAGKAEDLSGPVAVALIEERLARAKVLLLELSFVFTILLYLSFFNYKIFMENEKTYLSLVTEFFYGQVVEREVVADEVEDIQRVLRLWADERRLQLVTKP